MIFTKVCVDKVYFNAAERNKMIIKILIVLGSIIIDTLYNSIQEEHASKQDNIQFVRDAIVTHNACRGDGRRRVLIIGVDSITYDRSYFLKGADIRLDNNIFDCGDILSLNGKLVKLISNPIRSGTTYQYYIEFIDKVKQNDIYPGCSLTYRDISQNLTPIESSKFIK